MFSELTVLAEINLGVSDCLFNMFSPSYIHLELNSAVEKGPTLLLLGVSIPYYLGERRVELVNESHTLLRQRYL